MALQVGVLQGLAPFRPPQLIQAESEGGFGPAFLGFSGEENHAISAMVARTRPQAIMKTPKTVIGAKPASEAKNCSPDGAVAITIKTVIPVHTAVNQPICPDKRRSHCVSRAHNRVRSSESIRAS